VVGGSHCWTSTTSRRSTTLWVHLAGDALIVEVGEPAGRDTASATGDDESRGRCWVARLVGDAFAVLGGPRRSAGALAGLVSAGWPARSPRGLGEAAVVLADVRLAVQASMGISSARGNGSPAFDETRREEADVRHEYAAQKGARELAPVPTESGHRTAPNDRRRLGETRDGIRARGSWTVAYQPKCSARTARDPRGSKPWSGGSTPSAACSPPVFTSSTWQESTGENHPLDPPRVLDEAVPTGQGLDGPGDDPCRFAVQTAAARLLTGDHAIHCRRW
jgi:hypothetical protein